MASGSRVMQPVSETSEVQVTADDQKRINTFSRVYGVCRDLEDDANALREMLTSIGYAKDEIYLAAGDDVRCVAGEAYVKADVDYAEEFLEEEEAKVKEQLENTEQKVVDLQKRLKQLKGVLYAKFGKQINLEEDP